MFCIKTKSYLFIYLLIDCFFKIFSSAFENAKEKEKKDKKTKAFDFKATNCTKSLKRKN